MSSHFERECVRACVVTYMHALYRIVPGFCT